MKNDSWLCLNVICTKEKKNPIQWFPELQPACLGLVAWCSVLVDTEITFFQPSKQVMSGCIMSYMELLNRMRQHVAQHHAWSWEPRSELKELSAISMVIWIPGSGGNASKKLSRFPYSCHIVQWKPMALPQADDEYLNNYELGPIISVAEIEE